MLSEMSRHRTQVSCKVTASGGFMLQLRSLQQDLAVEAVPPPPVHLWASSWLPRREHRHSQLLLSHIHYNFILEVWNCSGLLRKHKKALFLQKEYEHSSFMFVDKNNLTSSTIYISFCSKSLEQRTLNTTFIIIRINYNHHKLLKYQCCGKQSWQYQCHNYLKK